MGHVAIWARAGSAEDRLAWDAWRKRWVVSCRAAATEGEANAAIAALVARWVGVPESRVRWSRAGRSRAKSLEVEGFTDAELSVRLERAADRDETR